MLATYQNGEKRVKRLCHLCLRQLKGSRSKTFSFLFFFWHGTQKWGRLEWGCDATLPPQVTIPVPWWPSQLSQQPLLHLAFERASLCGGVNKSQQISPRATNEIVITVIAPQKRPPGRHSCINNFFPEILLCCWVQVGSNRAAPPEEDASCLSVDALITSTVMSLAN